MGLPNPLNTLRTFSSGGKTRQFYSLPALAEAGVSIGRLPVSIRIVLESLLRNCDGKRGAEPAIRALAGWKPKETFETGLRKTVRWYLDNQAWVEEVTSGAYRDWMETNYGGR